MDSHDSLGSQIASAARDAWSSAAGAMDRLASSVGVSPTGGGLERLVRPPLDRGMAAWRWSNFGQSAVVPFPAPRLDDPRMLLTIIGLARVLYDEVDEQHQQHSRDRGAGGGGSPPLPLPPVTTAVAAAAVWRYFHPTLLREVCLSPYCVVERREVGRLWGACLTHLDATHLLSNLAAMLPDAAALERQSGPAALAADVVLLSALSSGLFVSWAVFEKDVMHRPNTYYAVGAVGLSSLAFALQVVRGESRRGSQVGVLGVPLPSQFSWVVQLGLTHLAAPDTSFAGHMCGVLAGIAHVYLLRPVLRALLGPGFVSPDQQPRFYGSGTTSGRPVAGGGVDTRKLRGALAQLALAAATVAVYALASQRRQRQPLSNWRLR